MLPSGNWLRSTWYTSLAEDIAQNTVWFSTATSIPPTTDIQMVATDMVTKINTVLLPLLSDQVSFTGVEVFLREGSATITAKAYSVTGGGDSNAPLPNGSAAIVRQQSIVGGGSGRGRHFFAGVSSGMTDGSFLNTTGITTAAALVLMLSSPQTFGGVTFDPQIYSRKLNALNKVSFATIDRVLGFRRKREPIF
jgi:hypothetical protein